MPTLRRNSTQYTAADGSARICGGVSDRRGHAPIAFLCLLTDSPAKLSSGKLRQSNFAMMAVDAIYLSHITGDKSLEKIATGALGWITGLHIGLEADVVVNPQTDKSLASACFIWNSDTRHAKPWSKWYWTPSKKCRALLMDSLSKRISSFTLTIGAREKPGSSMTEATYMPYAFMTTI